MGRTTTKMARRTKKTTINGRVANEKRNGTKNIRRRREKKKNGRRKKKKRRS